MGFVGRVATRVRATVRRRPRTVALWAVAVVVIFAGGLWFWWPAPAPPPPRARPYLDFTACLLTDDQGIAGPSAPVWAGLQDASLATRAKVQYLAVPGPQTESNALPFANSLAQRQCDLIFAAGVAPVAAARAVAPGYPAIHFYLVAASSPAPVSPPVPGPRTTESPRDAANLTTVTDADPRPAVAHLVTAAVDATHTQPGS
jgi:basic membrane lipoprotein Med (substrate-binding protein (PBP1-ABC) superfamily)